MEVRRIDPPRSFEVGYRGAHITHVADVELGDDEQVTFKTQSGTELDVVRKSWGYYATPSVNGRLAEHGLRAALTLGVPRDGQAPNRLYMLLVEAGREDEFQEYADAEGMRVIAWLDSDDAVDSAVRLLDSDAG
jgi:hypothetical protein